MKFPAPPSKYRKKLHEDMDRATFNHSDKYRDLTHYVKPSLIIVKDQKRDIEGLSFREAGRELGISLDNFRESTRLNDEG